VSAGIILLDKLEPEFALLPPAGEGLDVRKPFKINYLGRYSADFALSSGEPLDLGLGVSGESDTNMDLLQSLLLYLLNLFLLLLLSFLL
jgi:hypothetical protein